MAPLATTKTKATTKQSTTKKQAAKQTSGKITRPIKHSTRKPEISTTSFVVDSNDDEPISRGGLPSDSDIIMEDNREGTMEEEEEDDNSQLSML